MLNQSKIVNYVITNEDIFDKFARKDNYLGGNILSNAEVLEIAEKFYNDAIMKPFIKLLSVLIEKGADPHA